MENLPFEMLPQAVTMLTKEVGELKQLLISKQEQVSHTESEQPLTVEETAKFLKLSVPTIYGLIHKKKLVGMKPSKRRYFHKVELLDYLNQGRKKTCDEISIENDQYLKNSKKRK